MILDMAVRKFNKNAKNVSHIYLLFYGLFVIKSETDCMAFALVV